MQVSKALLRLRDPKEKEKAFLSSRTEFNDSIIETFLYQSREGINVPKIPNKKTRMRSPVRIRDLRTHLKSWDTWLNGYFNKTITEATENDILTIHNRLVKGDIKTKQGKTYKSTKNFSRDIKAFWHWYQKYMKKEHGQIIEDITESLGDDVDEKPDFHYFNFEQFKLMVNNAPYHYKVLMWFMYDTGVRSPSELVNIKVSDLTEKDDVLYLNIRGETSKTFGRKFKIMLCKDLLKEWIKSNNLNKNDYLFNITPNLVNRFLGRVGYRVLGFGEEYTVTEGKRVHKRHRNGLTMYDFRHCSGCYWRSKYSKESAFIYKFGWTNLKMANYYTEFLGMKDSISEDDLIDTEAKTRLEKELEVEKRKRELLEEEMNIKLNEMKDMLKEMWKKGELK